MSGEKGPRLPKRRTVLKSIGASLAAGSASGIANAQPASEVQYNQSKIEKHLGAAEDTVKLLSDFNLIQEPTYESFPTQTHVSLGEQHRRGEGTTVIAQKEELRHRVQTSLPVDDGTLTLFAELESEKSYAIYRFDNKSERYLLTPEIDGNIVELSRNQVTQAASTCTDEQCDLTSCIKEVERCLPVVGCYIDPQCVCGC